MFIGQVNIFNENLVLFIIIQINNAFLDKLYVGGRKKKLIVGTAAELGRVLFLPSDLTCVAPASV